jgi:hypothetical protein
VARLATPFLVLRKNPLGNSPDGKSIAFAYAVRTHYRSITGVARPSHASFIVVGGHGLADSGVGPECDAL